LNYWTYTDVEKARRYLEMKSLLVKSILGASLLLPSMAARAQYLGDQSYSESRARTLFDRVRSDLDRAESNADPTRGEADRFDMAQQRLNAFQRSWQAGRYDYRDLDDVIAAVQRVVSTNHLAFRDERNLRDDLDRMRAFEGREGY
jgi:hypothetical protein